MSMSDYPPELVEEALSFDQETIDHHPDPWVRWVLNDMRKEDDSECGRGLAQPSKVQVLKTATV